MRQTKDLEFTGSTPVRDTIWLEQINTSRGTLIMKNYICICGKEFNSSNALNGHRCNCKQHIIAKYGNLDSYYKKNRLISHNSGLAQRQISDKQHEAKLNIWITEKHICESCGQIMTKYYGSGRFCSSRCARSYSTSKNREEISKKASETLKGRFKGKTKKDIRNAQKIDIINNLIAVGYKYVTYPAIDFNDKYMVNSEGCIVSLHTFKKLSPSLGGDRYVRALLVDKEGKVHNLLVHRIVAYAFIPNPNNYPIINHKDENPGNNSVNNLEWCTYSYNMTYLNRHIDRGIKLSQTLKEKGGPWNKGIHKLDNTPS